MNNQQIKAAVQSLGDSFVRITKPKDMNQEEQEAYRNMVDLTTNVLTNLNDIAHYLGEVASNTSGGPR